MKKIWAIFSLLSIVFMIADLFGKDIHVSEMWSRASVDSATTAVAYMTIDNRGSEQDTLTAIQTEVAASAHIEEMTEENGVTKVTELKTLDIPGGQSKELKPQGTYIQLTGLRKALVKGESFPITLVFTKKGLVEDKVYIEPSDSTKYIEH